MDGKGEDEERFSFHRPDALSHGLYRGVRAEGRFHIHTNTLPFDDPQADADACPLPHPQPVHDSGADRDLYRIHIRHPGADTVAHADRPGFLALPDSNCTKCIGLQVSLAVSR